MKQSIRSYTEIISHCKLSSQLYYNNIQSVCVCFRFKTLFFKSILLLIFCFLIYNSFIDYTITYSSGTRESNVTLIFDCLWSTLFKIGSFICLFVFFFKLLCNIFVFIVHFVVVTLLSLFYISQLLRYSFSWSGETIHLIDIMTWIALFFFFVIIHN